MPTNVIMPKIAESIFEGTLTKWLKREGDVVKADEPLFEISTDKVDTEIPSPASGVLSKILVKEGQTVPIQTVVAVIEEKAAAPAPAAPRPQAPVKEAPAPAMVGAPAKEEAVEEAGVVFASPLVRKLAKDYGIDLKQITGTGYKGRITKEDVEAFVQAKQKAAAKPAEAPAPAKPVEAPVPVKPPEAPKAPAEVREIAVPEGVGPAAKIPLVITGPTETVTMTPMRKKIAEHMVLSKRISAHVLTVFEADLSKVTALREREKDYYETVYETKLTYTAFFAAAAVTALKEFPIINCSVDGDKIVYKKYINLGIAVALPDGLIVPVIRNAEEKSFLGLVRAINDLAERARTKKLTVDDVQGGTFTITNPGIFGGLFGAPIINQPQVAIMGVGGIQKRPVVVNDAIAIRPMVYLTLSFDHRVVDGADADRFMARVKQILENWEAPIK